MKNLILVFTLVALILGCSKEPTEIDPATITETILKSIDMSEDDGSGRFSIQEFKYDETGRLIRVEDTRIGNIILEARLEYEEDRLLQSSLYRVEEEEHFTYRDSFAYDQEGKLVRIYNFSVNGQSDLIPHIIYDLSYDEEGRLKKKTTAYTNELGLEYKDEYLWAGDNIRAVEKYGFEGTLDYVHTYRYDVKSNYKKDNAFFIKDPTSLNANNIIYVSVADYVGNYDACCNPCNSEYIYSGVDLPVEIELECGSVLDFKYQ